MSILNEWIMRKALIAFQILQLYKNKNMLIKDVIIESIE